VYETIVKVKKVSANISLGERLKEEAKKYANAVEMDLSELVAQLLREELANPTIGQKKGERASDAITGQPRIAR
jgi:hypothetical protein